MNTSPREHQRQVIDAEIKSLEESIRALRHRRNALAPVSSLPTEVIIAIFSILRLRGTPHLGKRPGCHPSLAWLNVTHVCHQWREIALDLPLFWSHVDFTNLTLTGMAEILARAKKAPLHLEARLLDSHRKVHWFSAFEMELQTRLSAICHLTISARPSRLHRTLKRLVSPAPTLETLSLSYPCEARSFIPDTLFDGVTPSLSTLKLYHCDISWKSPLLKGLKSLDIRGPSSDARPSIGVWLDALNEMPQLKRLVLHSASPSAFRFRFDVERTVTLPFLTHFNISDNTKECALALAHIVLPALTWLYITASSCSLTAGDSGTRRFLRYIAQHTHSLQDTQPLRKITRRHPGVARCRCRNRQHARLVRHDALCTPGDFFHDRRSSLSYHRRGIGGPPPAGPHDAHGRSPHTARRAVLAVSRAAVAPSPTRATTATCSTWVQ